MGANRARIRGVDRLVWLGRGIQEGLGVRVIFVLLLILLCLAMVMMLAYFVERFYFRVRCDLMVKRREKKHKVQPQMQLPEDYHFHPD